MNESPEGPDRVDAEDVDYFNRETMRDAAQRARLVATALVVVGAVGALAWLWLTIRTQQHAQGLSLGLGSDAEAPQATLLERFDGLTRTIGLLVSSALTFGLGIALSLLASHMTVSYGGTLTGVEEGDEFLSPPPGPPDDLSNGSPLGAQPDHPYTDPAT